MIGDPVPARTTSPQAAPAISISLVPVTASVAHAAIQQSPVIGGLKTALEGLQSSLNGLPPLQLAISGLLECIVRLRGEQRNYQAFEDLASDLTGLVTVLQRHVVESNPRNVPYSIANVARAIGEQTQVIKEHEDRSGISRIALALEDEEIVLNCYRRIGALFQQLQIDISLSIWDASREKQMDTRLNDLAPVHEARYNAALPTTVTRRVGCTQGTRTSLLEDTRGWARKADAPKICWLNGMAGTGKTTIAYTLCKILYDNNQLGGSFFCSRNSPDCRDVNKIVPTIAYQLGRYSNPYRQALCSMLEADPDIATHDISTQFEQLISKPLAQVSKAMPTDVVVVIDALDECSDVRGTKDVLEMLLRHASDLPLRFFIASRPEPSILDRMHAHNGALHSTIKLHDIEKSLVRADIKLYLAEALRSVGITAAELDALVDRAGSLFIFAATAVRYIVPDRGPVDHRKRLLAVLKLDPGQGNKTYKDIDKLYETILSNALDVDIFEEDELASRRQVLWTVVCAREPLKMLALAEILHMTEDQAVQLAIQPLQSVIHVSEITQLVSPLHASFPDYLLSKDRAGRFHCDEALQSAYLAECCFRLMERSLCFNICGLESSYLLDSEVPDIQNRVDSAILTGLFYSCMYWGDHLTRSSPSPSLISLLDSFMRRQLLFWLEVLNLKGQIGHADRMLGQAQIWLATESNTADLGDFIYDARNFTVTLASSPVSHSTPHIYLSALPFTLATSRVRETYWPNLRGLMRLDSAVMQTRGMFALATWEVGAHVYCIARSSNGRLIASGSERLTDDDTKYNFEAEVSLWDVSRGICVLGPLLGHNGAVLSVSFSPDNTRLASSSSDKTVRIWDMSNGATIVGPLEGHTSYVCSVAFSPNGLYVASGSDDCTIRLWNANSGAPSGEPLQGHQGAVTSVAFSPNGKHLASSSDDCTIQVWDYLAGTAVQKPMVGHGGAVHSIAYSHDGLRLASGSVDRTVRVWNTSDGTLLAGPFEGHTMPVKSVSFSPDGAQVVSGSEDRTTRVWEAASGSLLVGPLGGHIFGVKSVLFTTDGTRILSASGQTIHVWDARHRTPDATRPLGYSGVIYSVALSPDGTHLASGSGDNTICVWNARNGTLVTGPLKGHLYEVTSVAFSPDGARIVSGSTDRTLCIWDTFSGALLVGPIQGHTGWIWSVVFSPDGSQIASGSWDRTIRLWDSHTGKSIGKPFRHKGQVFSVAFSPDGTRIASGSFPPPPNIPSSPAHSIGDSSPDDIADNSRNDDLDDDVDATVEPMVRMWHAKDGAAPIWRSHAHTESASYYCIAFSSDGMQVVSGSAEGTICMLDARNGSVLHRPFRAHDARINSVAFSPDGARVVSGSDDRTVRVWDVESGTMVAGPLKGHTGSVNSIVLSLNGQRIISGSTDGTIRIWDVTAIARASATSSDDWSIDRNGWLTNTRSQRLLWVPFDLRDRFGYLTASNPIVINADCTVRIDETTLLGDRWVGCYDVTLGLTSP